MKLDCRVLVQPSGRARPCKGIVWLARSRDANPKYELRVSTSADTKGRAFPLNEDTVRAIQTRFVKDGNATFQFRRPSVDVLISMANRERLRRFLTLTSQILRGESVSVCSALKVTAGDFNSEPKNLIIDEMRDYPRAPKGFPSSLRQLSIFGIGLRAVDGRWFALSSLEHLQLNNNFFGESPNFGTKFLNIVRLRNLKTLSLASNSISNFTTDQWMALPESLMALDISSNSFTSISPLIARLRNLAKLNISSNQISLIPEQIFWLRALRVLDASNNRLRYLPATLQSMSLDIIDVTGNPKLSTRLPDQFRLDDEIAPLALLAAAVVVGKHVSQAELPWDVQRWMLDDITVCSLCHAALCRDYAFSLCKNVDLKTLATSVVLHPVDRAFAPMKFYCCRHCKRCV